MTDILSSVKAHDRWRLEDCINLQPSENVTSPQVRRILSSDLVHRYTLIFDQVLHGVYVENAYRGTKYLDEIEAEGEKLACEVFGSKYASLKPLSGHVSALMMLIASCKRGDEVLTIRPEHGGYDGYWEGYMPEILGLKVSSLPFLEEDWNLDHERSAEEIIKRKPRLVVIGASFFLFPYDLKVLRDACDEAGSLLGYDASHVLGLIAGGEFQKPLQDGADIVCGSTHKTFFGPQGGMILTNREDLNEAIKKTIFWTVMDNAHWNRIGALAQSLLEMKEFGSEYAKQVVSNSKALAKNLEDSDFPLKYRHKGYTDCHQTMVDTEAVQGKTGLTPHEYSCKLEESNIIVDSVGRLGTNELTRIGANEETMANVAGLLLRTLKGEDVKPEAKELRSSLKLKYVFDE
ncbi:MAG: serine hydroxymethyltransferase [Thermoplasmata archaeon]|nr:serine hydroxymethyltransferase [Thermoplasmata archaeon]